MSPKKKLIAWVSAAVATPGAVLVWHVAEKLHTLQWFLHLSENKNVLAGWEFLTSPPGQTILLLCLLGSAALILRELRARRKRKVEVVVLRPPENIVKRAEPVAPVAPVVPRKTVTTVTRTKTETVTRTQTDRITVEQVEEPVETTIS